MKIIGLFVLGVFLGGCATTQDPQLTSQLQGRVGELERQLDMKDQELRDLKFQVKDLSHDINKLSAQQKRTASSVGTPAGTVSQTTAVTDGEIIRVQASVQDVQAALKKAGFYDGAIDGKIGNMTKSGIENFQRSKNLKADGIVGRQTWAALREYLKN